MRGPKLLIIEDDVAIIDLLAMNFEMHGFEVCGCDRSTLALPVCLMELPDVIVLDLLMPEQNGWQVLECLNGNPVTRDVPVVICSVMGSHEERARAERMGVVDYLVKPFELADLLDAVIRATGWKGMAEQLVVPEFHFRASAGSPPAESRRGL
ncbi:MAG: response regulator [Candidatus Geothermincolia bacterium]